MRGEYLLIYMKCHTIVEHDHVHPPTTPTPYPICSGAIWSVKIPGEQGTPQINFDQGSPYHGVGKTKPKSIDDINREYVCFFNFHIKLCVIGL